MPDYKYQGTSRSGSSVSGVMTAANKTELASILKRQQITATKMTEKGKEFNIPTFGGGVKAKISRRVMFRAEVQDYLTPFPRQVIAEGPGAKINGMLHDIVFTAGIGFVF